MTETIFWGLRFCHRAYTASFQGRAPSLRGAIPPTARAQGLRASAMAFLTAAVLLGSNNVGSLSAAENPEPPASDPVIAAPAQTGEVTGRVVDERTGQPVRAVHVTVLGTALGTFTNDEGRFRLQGVPAGDATVRVQRLGYAVGEAVVRVEEGRTATADFSLAQQALGLDEIIVTGTPGGAQRRALGHDVARVDVSGLMEKAPISSMQQLLQGRAAGVSVFAGSGNLGGGGTIRMRGTGSFSLTSQPIVYIDGVRVDSRSGTGPNIRQGRAVSRLNDLNPNDIESIEIIKGPAAATLYGTEASGGVIQVLTKRGRLGEPRIDVHTRFGVNWFRNAIGRTSANYGIDPSSGELLRHHPIEAEKAAGQPIFEAGPVQEYAASVRGGTERFGYYGSVDYQDETGMLWYNWEKNLNSRLNLQANLSETVDVGASFGVTRGATRFAQAFTGFGIWDGIVWGSPLQPPESRGFRYVPPEVASEIESLANVDRGTWTLQGDHAPRDWFRQRLIVGADVVDEVNTILFPRHPDGDSYWFAARSLGDKTLERFKVTNTTFDYTGILTFPVREEVVSSTSVGVQHYAKRIESSFIHGRNFPAPAVTTIAGAAQSTGADDIIENKTLGVYVQQGVEWRNRVFATVALRADDNSAFGDEFSAAIYPKTSLAWVISEEPFWSVPWMNTLRLRGAWGQAGQQPDVFAAMRLYEPITAFGEGSGLTPQNLGNPELKPETGEEFDLGFDAGLLDDRLTVTLSYYRQNTKDAIIMLPVSPSSGFPGSRPANIGALSNRGWELGIDARLLERPDVGWGVQVNFSTNRNRVESLGDLPSLGGTQQSRVGYPVASWWEREVVHVELNSQGEMVERLCAGGPENNHQAVPCETAPEVFRGRPTPAWEGAVSTDVTLFGRLSLYALVDFKGGFYRRDGDVAAAHILFRTSQAINGTSHPILHGYAPQDIATWPSAGHFNAGFAQLREVSTTYRVPSGWAERFGASAASVTLSGRNLGRIWAAEREIFGRKIVEHEWGSVSDELSAYTQTRLPQFTSLVATFRMSL